MLACSACFFNVSLHASELSSTSGALDCECALAFHFCALMDYVASFIQTFFPDFFIRNFNAIVIGIGVAVGIAIWVLTRKKK